MGYHKPTMVSKRLSLCSTVDLAPVILPYDLIIGTDDNMSTTPIITPIGEVNGSLFRCSWSMEVYVEMLRNTAPGRNV